MHESFPRAKTERVQDDNSGMAPLGDPSAPWKARAFGLSFPALSAGQRGVRPLLLSKLRRDLFVAGGLHWPAGGYEGGSVDAGYDRESCDETDLVRDCADR